MQRTSSCRHLLRRRPRLSRLAARREATMWHRQRRERQEVALAGDSAQRQAPPPASPLAPAQPNGPVGLESTLGAPAIGRKMAMGLLRYDTAEDADSFLVSSAVGPIPALCLDSAGAWTPAMPRVEERFARIERRQRRT